MKAKLAEANEKINKLSEDMNETRGGSYKHNTLEDLHNSRDKVQTVLLDVEIQQIKARIESELERKFTQEIQQIEARLGRAPLELERKITQVQCLTSEGVVLSKEQLWGVVLQRSTRTTNPPPFVGLKKEAFTISTVQPLLSRVFSYCLIEYTCFYMKNMMRMREIDLI